MTATAIPTTATGENYYKSSTTLKEEAAARDKAQADARVSHDEFLKLLTAQLTNQDPLSPMEDQQFIGQMAQLQTLDEQVEMTDAITQMASATQTNNDAMLAALAALAASNEENTALMVDAIRGSGAGSQIQAASAMIGKHVTGTDTDGLEADGNVLRATLSQGMAYLELDSDQKVWLGAVTSVE